MRNMYVLHLYDVDEYSNINRIVVPNIQILIFGIRFSSSYISSIQWLDQVNATLSDERPQARLRNKTY